MDHIAITPTNHLYFSNPDRVSQSISDVLLIPEYPIIDSSIDALDVLQKQAERLPALSVDPLWSKYRFSMLDWGYKFVDFWNCDRSVMAKAAKLSDQFLSCHQWHQLEFSTTNTIDRLSTKDENEYMKLTSVVSIELAMKLLGAHRYPSFDFLSRLTQSTISESELKQHEYKMLDTLHWDINPPIPQEFLHELIKLIPHRENITVASDIAAFQIEVSVLKPEIFSAEKASDIALAALLNGLDIAINSEETRHNQISEMDVRSFENMVSNEVFKDPSLIANMRDLREKLQHIAHTQ